ncbi:MAG: FAD:protein FMN transferase [Eubacteriales bacterium]|nr:FAD:protein FMN transferase [Eubacteriales bacterium]
MHKSRIIPLIVFVLAGLAALAAVFLPRTVTTVELVRYKTSFFDVFDTYSEITVYAATEGEAEAIANQAHTSLTAYHQLYDIYNDYDGIVNLKTVNAQAGAAPVTVDERILNLLTFAKAMAGETNGRMNIAMGSVLAIWHDYRTRGLDDPASAALPSMAQLQAAAEHCNIDDVVLDPVAKTVYLADPALQLDVGAVAKGFAVERVAAQMVAQGVTSALLSIGGNVRAIGVRGDGSAWRANVQNPDLTAENQSIATLSLADRSLVTSGSYQRYYTVDGKQYHHIIDPDTLFPADKLWAVSVVTQDSGLADALSTALFTLSIEDGKALLKRFDGVDALWVTPDGAITQSAGFAALTDTESTAE